MYNVVGALVWTVLFLGAGFFFGNLPGRHAAVQSVSWACQMSCTPTCVSNGPRNLIKMQIESNRFL